MKATKILYTVTICTTKVHQTQREFETYTEAQEWAMEKAKDIRAHGNSNVKWYIDEHTVPVYRLIARKADGTLVKVDDPELFQTSEFYTAAAAMDAAHNIMKYPFEYTEDFVEVFVVQGTMLRANGETIESI